MGGVWSSVKAFWREVLAWPQLLPLLRGQWISILLAGTGIFATILSETKPSTNFPLLLSSCNYALLSTYLLRGSRCFSNNNRTPPYNEFVEDDLLLTDKSSSSSSTSKTVWKFIRGLTKLHQEEEDNDDETKRYHRAWYIFAAILDVEANFLVILAYNYTTITSIMLLDCFTIPCCMILSYVFLGCRYTSKHLFGILLCLLGLVCIIMNDWFGPDKKDNEEVSNAVLGDILCLSGAVLYACSNVLQETMVKFTSRNRYLGYLGSYGWFIAFTQCMLLELPHIRRANITLEVVISIISFVLCLFFMYTNTSAFLQQQGSDTIIFNLSLLTSDIYAVLFTFLFHGYLVSWLYFVSFALVMGGLYVYYSETSPINLTNLTLRKRNERHEEKAWAGDAGDAGHHCCCISYGCISYIYTIYIILLIYLYNTTYLTLLHYYTNQYALLYPQIYTIIATNTHYYTHQYTLLYPPIYTYTHQYTLL